MGHAAGARMGNDLRRLALFFMLAEPLSWRTRRVDRFVNLGSDALRQEIQIDIRIRRSFADRLLVGLAQAYGATGRRQDLRQVELIQASEDADEAEASPWNRLDLLVPVAWLSGPPMNLAVTLEGQSVVPLTRREASDVMGTAWASFIVSFSESAESPLASVPWAAVGWCLQASDNHAMREQAALKGMKAPLDGAENVEQLCSWIADNLRLQRLEPLDEAGRVWLRERVVGIQREAERHRATWELLQEPETRFLDDYHAYHPGANPLLLHYSFLKWSAWESRSDRQGLPRCKSSRASLACFFGMCDAYLEMVAKVGECMGATAHTAQTPGSPGDRAAELLLLAEKMALSWPVVVRAQLPVGKTVRFMIDEVIPMPQGRNEPDPPDRWVKAQSIGIVPGPVVSLMRRASRGLTHLWLWLLNRLGYKRSITQVNAQSYPLALCDSMAYHVEVRSDDPELSLVPHGSFVKYPHRDYRSTGARLRFSSTPWAQFLPYRHVKSCEVFGRVTDGGTVLHHFYTTKTMGQPRAEGRYQAEAGGSTLLVVGYRIADAVTAANWLPAILLAGLALAATRVSLLESIRLPTGDVNFAELTRSSVAWYLTVLLLFAFEKHRDPRVARSLLWPSYIVIGSFGLFVAAWVLRTMVVDPPSLPRLPEPVQSALVGTWTALATWLTSLGVSSLLGIATLVAIGTPVLLSALPIGFVLACSRWGETE
jgi:hypothetical protein